MARLRGFSAAIPLIEERLTGEPRRQRLIKLAHDAINAAAAQNRAALGQEVDREIIVDGRRHAAIESAKPGGTVVALFAVHLAAVDFTWQTLFELSPVDTNPKTVNDIVYSQDRLMLVNGRQSGPPPVHIGIDDVVTFVNLEPYARKIEGGPGRKPISEQAPDGVYEVASEIVRNKFGNIVDVKFSYGAFLGASATRENRYPYIELSPKKRR